MPKVLRHANAERCVTTLALAGSFALTVVPVKEKNGLASGFQNNTEEPGGNCEMLL